MPQGQALAQNWGEGPSSSRSRGRNVYGAVWTEGKSEGLQRRDTSGQGPSGRRTVMCGLQLQGKRHGRLSVGLWEEDVNKECDVNGPQWTFCWEHLRPLESYRKAREKARGEFSPHKSLRENSENLDYYSQWDYRPRRSGDTQALYVKLHGKLHLVHGKCSIPPSLGRGFPGGSRVKNLPANGGDAGDPGLIPGSEDPLEECDPLQSSYLKNSMDREAWWAAAHEVSKSRIRLSTHASSLGNWF